LQALFGHVKGSGSLLHLIDAHYDPQTVGKKTEASSYAAIMAKYNPGERFLFVTDNPLEAKAATAAGFHGVVLASRPGNAPLPPDVVAPVVKTFDSLFTMFEFISANCDVPADQSK
jgi:methionine salvage enolase-phosphatase E1